MTYPADRPEPQPKGAWQGKAQADRKDAGVHHKRIVELPLATLTFDPRCQMRVELQEDVAAGYAEAMMAGAVFPPLIAFHEARAGRRWVGDGFARGRAYQLADIKTCQVDLRDGTLRTAILFAAGANATHGLQRRNEDKRKAVKALLGDEEWAAWTNAEIARRCGVSDWLVGQVRQELSPSPLGMRVAERGGTIYEMRVPAGPRQGQPAADDWEREAREGLGLAQRALTRLKRTRALELVREALEDLNDGQRRAA